MNSRGHVVWSLKKPSSSVDKLPAFLRKHLRRFHGQLNGLAVGSRGVWKEPKRKAVRRALKGLAKKIVVMSDVEAAWLAAFGQRNAQRAMRNASHRATPHALRAAGIVVIAGTGSIAYGRRADGIFARAGGLGPEKGDEGSGYWIGKELLRRSGGTGERKRTVREVAKIAPSVIQKAKRGHPLAPTIIHEAQAYLADLVRQVVRKLHWKGPVPLSVSGSVLENGWFRHGFLRCLHTRGVRIRFIRRRIDPAVALSALV